MAHFAKLDVDDMVLEVHRVANEALDPEDEESSGIAFLTQWSGGYPHWRQCSYNGTIRKNFPGQGSGWRYDSELNAFVLPQPFPSWTLNPQTALWDAPIPRPEVGDWRWDEDSQSWVAVFLP